MRPKIGEYSGQFVRYAQEKKDGYFVELHRFNNRLHVKTKNGGEINNSLYCINVSIPNDTIIYGELYWDGQATSVVTLINENDPRLKFAAFALQEYRGNDMSDVDDLSFINMLLTSMGFKTPHLEVFDCLKQFDPEEWKAKAEKLGWEGYVMKEAHLKGWYKCKPQRTVDAFVVDYTVSESDTYCGSLKAFIVAVLDEVGQHKIIASVGSGFDKEFKLNNDPKDFVGRIMEVKFQSVAAKGKLQFPRFVRWRDDKNYDQCGIDQLEN